MSIFTKGNRASTIEAVRLAARALEARSGSGSVFLEERTDIVLTIGRDVPRTLAITPSRGATIGDDERSIHVADPTLEELVSLGRGGAEPSSHAAHNDADEVDLDDIHRYERTLRETIESGIVGYGDVQWTASVIAFNQNVWVSDRDGTVTTDRRKSCRTELKLRIGHASDRVAVADHVHAPNDDALPPGRVRVMLDRLDRRRPARRVPSGATGAVFAAGVGGLLVHELVGHALEGDVLGRQSTWLVHELPKSGRPFRVEDDPRRGRAAWANDDEGVSSRSVLLTDGDRVAGCLLDRAAAAARSTSSTGHGRRATFRDPVRPRMGCTFIHAGDDDPAAIIAETDSGVFVRRMTAGHVDPVRGLASFVVSDADLIERGRCVVPVEPFVIDVRGAEMWSTLDRVGADLVFDACVGSCVRDGQPLAVSVGAPTIRIGVITVNC